MTVDDAIEHVGFGRFQMMLLFVCLTAWLADGMQPILVSFLIPVLKQNEWEIDQVQQGLLGAITFGGMLIGSIVWGNISDHKGRKWVLYITVAITSIMGIAASFAPEIYSLIVMQGLLGIGVGGNLPVVYSLFVEFVPSAKRGFYLTILASAWSIGELIVSALAWAVLPTLGWRWLVRLSALPGLAIFFFITVVPESPRFLLICGKYERAENILRQVSHWNRKPFIGEFSLKQQTAQDSGKEELGSIRRLFSPTLRKLTFYTWIIWFLGSVGLYGVLIFLPTFFEKKGMPTMDVYENVFISGLANIPGIVSAAFLIETRMGRRRTMALYSILTAVCILALGPSSSYIALVAIVLCCKFFLYGLWGVIDCYTPESYPTTIRSTGNAAASSMARLAGLTSPLFNVYLLESSIWVALCLWAGALVIVSISALLLPVETRGMELQQTVAAHKEHNTRSKSIVS